MEELLLNERIAAGLAKAAMIVGRPYAVYRPSSAIQPLESTLITTLSCAFDVKPEFSLLSTAQEGHSYTVLLADPREVKKNDYLVGDNTYFVARVESLRPVLCVLCDTTFDLLTTGISSSIGNTAYGGRTSATDIVIATNWPASMVSKTKGEADVTKLPSDIRAAYYDILLPVIPYIIITFGMQLQDQNGQNYEIISTELSQFGWKILAGLITT